MHSHSIKIGERVRMEDRARRDATIAALLMRQERLRSDTQRRLDQDGVVTLQLGEGQHETIDVEDGRIHAVAIDIRDVTVGDHWFLDVTAEWVVLRKDQVPPRVHEDG